MKARINLRSNLVSVLRVILVISFCIPGTIVQSQQSMEIGGGLKVGDTTTPAQGTDAGTIRWNETSGDFEGWTGTEWVSLTAGTSDSGSGNSWGKSCITETSHTYPPPATGSQIGWAIAIDGDHAVIGAPEASVSSVKTGKAFIYERIGREWHLVADLTSSDGAADDLFGYSVDIDGEFVIIGSPEHDTNGNLDQGSAYIFQMPVTGWNDMQETVKLLATDGAIEDQFGLSVSLSEDILIIGSPYHDTDGNDAKGKAYLYELQGSTWLNIAILTSGDGIANDAFGYSVNIDSNLVIVGAIGAWEFATGPKAYLFEEPNTGWTSMTQTAILLTTDGGASDNFGQSVAIDGNAVVIGAPRHDCGGLNNNGKVYVYEKPDSGWVDTTETAQLKISDGADNDRFGFSIGISQGNVIVGSWGYGSAETGQAFIFSKPDGGWSDGMVPIYLSARDGSFGDLLGWGVAIDKNWAAAGAIGFDFNGLSNEEHGKVYFYKNHE